MASNGVIDKNVAFDAIEKLREKLCLCTLIYFSLLVLKFSLFFFQSL